MSLRRDVQNVVNLREFHRSVEQLLTPGDRDYLFYALKEYNTYKSVAKLMLALNSCLDTPEKLDLLPYVRELIPRHDRKKFDSLAPYNRMARATSPPTATKPQEHVSIASSAKPSTLPTPSHEAVRVIILQRPKGTSLGFSIRGGREHELGIYVSHVDSLSLAEKCGLLPGDQILNVNGVSFEQITHSSAALVLTSHDDFRMVVKSVGRIPGRKIARNSFVWVDAGGKPIGEVDSMPDTTEMVTENRAAGHRLLASPDRHKVVLHGSKRKPLGFSIRGGSEYDLGIYISAIDKDGVAEETGLRVGDQILDVNGHSFVNIIHAEAVTILRSYPTLIMTVKSLGKLPRLATELQAGDEDKSRTERPSNLSYDQEDSGVRSRTSSFFRALTSPLSPRRKSPPKRIDMPYTSDVALYKGQTTSEPTGARRTSPNKDQAHYASEVALHRTQETAVRSHPPVKSRDSNVRRVRSFNEPKEESVLKGPRGQSEVGTSQVRTHASSTGSNTLPRTRGTKSPIGVSPLVTSNVRAITSPTHTSLHSTRNEVGSRHARHMQAELRDGQGPRHQMTHSPEKPQGNRAGGYVVNGPEPHQVRTQSGSFHRGSGTTPRIPSPPDSGTNTEAENHSPRFFEHGIGTQVMLSSSSSQAMGILLSRARQLLDDDAVDKLREMILQYEQTKQIEQLVQCLTAILDTSEKLQLLTDIRSVLQPADLAKFDALVSSRELEALHERTSRHDSEGKYWGQYDLQAMEEDQNHDDEVTNNYTLVLTEMQKHGGQRGLRNSTDEPSHSHYPQTHDLGAFGNSSAQQMLEKASSDEPSMIGVQTKESFLAWNDEYDDYRRSRGSESEHIDSSVISPRSPVVIELPKSAPNLGLSIYGGVDTPMSGVRIKEVLEGGAAHKDGFLKAGFEIVEVDGIKVRGKTHEEAARTIAQAFSSENPTIEFVVVPN